jgi:hypothetical protein
MIGATPQIAAIFRSRVPPRPCVKILKLLRFENAAGRCGTRVYAWTGCHAIGARLSPNVQGSHTIMVSVYRADHWQPWKRDRKDTIGAYDDIVARLKLFGVDGNVSNAA